MQAYLDIPHDPGLVSKGMCLRTFSLCQYTSVASPRCGIHPRNGLQSARRQEPIYRDRYYTRGNTGFEATVTGGSLPTDRHRHARGSACSCVTADAPCNQMIETQSARPGEDQRHQHDKIDQRQLEAIAADIVAIAGVDTHPGHNRQHYQ